MEGGNGPRVVFGGEDLAFFAQVGRGAYLAENQARLSELALAQEALARLIERDAPDLAAEISRFDAVSADPLLRELFPAADTAVNGWRVEVQLLGSPDGVLGVDRAFARSAARPDVYVALAVGGQGDGLAVGGQGDGLAVEFVGWLGRERLADRPAAADDDGLARVPAAALDAGWPALLERLRPAGAAPPAPEAGGEHAIEADAAALPAGLERLLAAPHTLPAAEYAHWLACPLCQDRAVHRLRREREATAALAEVRHFLAAGRPLGALARLEQALEPELPEAPAARMAALWQLGRYADALAASSAALRGALDLVPVYRARAALYHLLGRTEAAVAELREAVARGVEGIDSLFAPPRLQPQPVPAWAYVPAARAGSRPRVLVIDAAPPGRVVACRVDGPEIRPDQGETILALHARDLPAGLAGRRFRVLILDRELEALLGGRAGREGPALLLAVLRPGLEAEWRLAMLDLALLRNRAGLPVEGKVSEEGVIDVWEPIADVPPEALEAKTVAVYLFEPGEGRA